MSLDHLWAGWRKAYVTGASAPGPAPTPAPSTDEPSPAGDDGPCVFCRLAASGPPASESGVLWVGSTSMVVLNAYPYASGHVMAVPLRHVGAVGDLTGEEWTELWTATRLGLAAVEAAYRPGGFNVGANLGEAAGAGIPRHLHVHVVPRWSGDTNFMTAIADTRVLPETLASSWERLRSAWPPEGESVTGGART